MIKTSAAALLLSTALMTGAALAQTTTTEPSATAPASGMTSTTTAPATTTAATTGSGQFMSQQDQGQYRASKFVGLAIYGSDNQRVGDINEILIDSAGAAKGVVIGVGGFLGIGEKNVAVPFSAVQWVNERPVTASASAPATGGTTTSATTTGASSPASSAAMGSRDASSTGSTAASPAPVTAGTPATASRSPAETAAMNGYPDHGKIAMTKADLQNAPDFKWYGSNK